MDNNDAIQIFENSEFGKVRIIKEGEQILFCASDVARALGYAVPHKAVWDKCKGVLKRNIPTSGGTQDISFIPESDVYRLIFGSKLDSAERFQSWVFDTILPSIRKTGGYIMGEETMSDDELLARALIMAQKKIELRDKELKEKNELLELQKPKVEFADHVAASKNSIDMGDFAKLVQKNGIDLGRNKLFSVLRKMGVLMKDNVPYQQYMDLGWFEVIEMPFVKSGEVYTTFKTLVTGKGQVGIIKKLKKGII